MFTTETGGDWTLFERIVDCVASIKLVSIKKGTTKAAGLNGRITYGGRKNCSRDTHIPLIISIRRKYFPALSSALSLLSSHRFGLDSLKPGGGGPAGVAARGMLVEKKTIVVGEGVRETLDSAVPGLLPASIINDFALAIAYVGRVWQLWLWRLLRR